MVGNNPLAKSSSVSSPTEDSRKDEEGCIGILTCLDDPHVSRLVWKPSRNGKFSVRSVYKLVMELKEQRVASLSRSWHVEDGDSSALWRKLWSTQVPPRLKVMAWRFCFDVVPSFANLLRNPEVIMGCVRCGAASESLLHILAECDYSRVVWALSNIPWHTLANWSEGVAMWIARLSVNVSKEEVEWFLTICWAQWHSRNKLVTEGKSSSPLRVIQEAFMFLNQYREVRAKMRRSVS
ncbi:hypothetical protein Salat_1702100 [Sesamum alatum]|uniref:Reverse transcriptase zinc-binding domain-containing protein n=1 Tax=Sesamum alatum TaxID=300844 RepID=A0AAE1Y8L8_9LAMI|nr:hypothetical protein Salat_1702100 [Sesamum alatum]